MGVQLWLANGNPEGIGKNPAEYTWGHLNNSYMSNSSKIHNMKKITRYKGEPLC